MNAKELADPHWQWVEGLFQAMGVEAIPVAAAGYLYRTVWEHAVKHERESAEARRIFEPSVQMTPAAWPYER